MEVTTPATPAGPPADLIRSIIGAVNPGHAEAAAQWERDEALYRAAHDVAARLAPFTWETSVVTSPDAAGYALRKERAVYVPFLMMRAEAFVGTVFQRAPQPGAGLSFGALGEPGVRKTREGREYPTRAQMLLDAADGVGKDAQGLLGFFEATMGLASATDYRWVRVDERPGGRSTEEDEIRGRRPYFVEHGPQDVPYTIFAEGSLQAARVVSNVRVRKVEGGRYTDEVQRRHLLMARAGFAEWGEAFAGGGWWLCNDEGVVLGVGDWDRLGGEIPMFRVSYKRAANGDPLPSGATWLNNLALAHMDAGSWHWNDLKVSGGRKRYWLGADPQQWEELAKQAANGAVEVPVPGRADGGEVKVYDTGEVTVGAAMRAYQEGLETTAARRFLRELTESPGASGASKMVEVLQGRSPLLAHVAANLEDAMWTGLRFIEQRWTGTASPTADVTWPRDFDLRSAAEKVAELFALFDGAKLTVPGALGGPLLRAAAEGTGLVASGAGGVDMDAVEADVSRQLGAAIDRTETAAARDRDLAALEASILGGDGAAGRPTGPTPAPEAP